MKNGATAIDRQRIKSMSADGASVSQIAKALRISEDVVKAFMPKKKKAVKKKADVPE